MEEVVSQSGGWIVVCTAAQPAVDSFFQSGLRALELCPRMEEQCRFCERVSFQNIGMVTERELLERLETQEQALCIVNTRKRAQSLYTQLAGEGVFHLSTSMYPSHRRLVLQKIRQRLQEGKKCLLISPRLVEAGGELDFRALYREPAGGNAMDQAVWGGQ